MRATSHALFAVALAFVACGCGARTGVIDPDAGVGCLSDEECDDGLVCNGVERCLETRCRRGPALVCDDHDECTDDACEEPTGCAIEPLRVDADRDDYDVLRPDGPASCGDDCDDHNPAVHPGATEICNGIDDNCNGAIDEGAAYMPSFSDVRITSDAYPSNRGNVAWSPVSETWGATYWDYGTGSADIYFTQLDPLGSPTGERKLLTLEPGDAYGTSILWDGREYAVLWQDRRDGDYELYFNRLTPDGEKLASDYRVTYAAGWSINYSLRWSGHEYVVAWQDGRHESEIPDNFEIYMTFLDGEGFEIGDDIRLTNDPASSEGPSIALGGDEVGVAFVDNRTGMQQVWFMTTDLMGRVRMPAEQLSVGSRRATNPVVAWADGGFVVVWQDEPSEEDRDIAAARVPRMPAGPVEGPLRLVFGAQWSRAPALLANGDRVVVVYSDDRGAGYDLYMGLFDPSLTRLTEDVQVTTAPGDSMFAGLARGGTSIGVLFEDQRDGNWEVYFTRLLCAE